MKNILKKFSLLLSLLPAVSCTEVDVESYGRSDVEVKLTGQFLTRVSENKWDEGDAVGVYMFKYGSQLSDESVIDNSANCKYVATEQGELSPGTETDKLYYPLAESVNFIAYYPFDNVEDYTVGLDVGQQGNPSLIDFLYCNNLKNVTATNTVQELVFSHQLSKVLFDIKPGYGIDEADLEGITVTIRNAVSDADFSLTDGSLSLGTRRQSMEVKAAVQEAEAVAHAEAIMIPQSCDDVILMVSLASGRSFFFTFDSGYKWESGRKYAYEINLTDNQVSASLAATITDWNEGVAGGIKDVTVPEAWDGTSVDTEWYKNEATAFTLYQPADLAGLAKLVNEGKSFEGKTVSLFVDLDMNNKPWTPIGITDENTFKGTFEGNNCQILNLNPVLAKGMNTAGLFGVSDGVVRKLTVCGDFYIEYDKGGMLYSGAVCGINKGTIQNCCSRVDMILKMKYESTEQTNIYAGGITGSDLSGTVSTCRNYGSIIAENINTNAKAYLHIGGIAGGASGSGASISDCENMRNLTGRNGNVRMGGIAAIASGESVTVERCSNYGDVVIEASHNEAVAGGVVGKNAKSAVVKTAYNKGAIDVTLSSGVMAYGGGLVGLNDCATVSSGANYGHVTVVGSMADESAAAAGGIVGYNTNSASVHKGTNHATSSASNAVYCFSGGITGFNKVETDAKAYTYDCCSNEGVPAMWIGNADAENDLITTTEHTDE